jgi:predicted DNA-binding transcriptional regulator AlpA
MQLPMGFTHEQFVDGQRAAEFLGLPRKTLLNLARRGSVPAHPLGEGIRHTWRFRISELASWVQSKTVESGSHRGQREESIP